MTPNNNATVSDVLKFAVPGVMMLTFGEVTTLPPVALPSVNAVLCTVTAEEPVPSATVRAATLTVLPPAVAPIFALELPATVSVPGRPKTLVAESGLRSLAPLNACPASRYTAPPVAAAEFCPLMVRGLAVV